MSGLRRKAVIKSQPKTRRSHRLDDLVGVRHLHFCSDRECRLIYEDSCVSPEDAALCPTCKGRERSVYMPYRDPQECCLDNTKQVTYAPDLLKYQLAGPGPWFQCKTCARCHGWSCSTS